MIKREILRLVRVAIGFACYSFGIYFGIHASIGLAPWDAFAMGLANLFQSTYGTMNVAIGLVVLFLTIGVFREKFGLATPLNAVLIGAGVDVIEGWSLLPYMDNFFLGILVLLAGQFLICVGTVLYVPTALGCGPRDSLMVALAKRFPRIKIGVVRGCIEASVLAIGWLLGAKVGLGTVISVFGIGSMLQLTCMLFHCDLKGIVHESCLDTLRRWKREFLAEHQSISD